MIRPLMFAVLVSLAGVAAAETLHGRVSEIIDGDTLRVELAQRGPSLVRLAWVDAPDLDAQKKIAAEIQRQCWVDVPHLPLGIWFQPVAWQKTIDGIPDGFPLFWGAKRV